MVDYTQTLNSISRNLGEIKDGINLSSTLMIPKIEYLADTLQTTNIILSILAFILGLNLLLQWKIYKKK